MVLFGYPTASIFEKEDYAAMTVLGAVMAGYHYPGGWLHNELRGEGLVYFVHAMQMTGPVPGYFEIVAQTRPDKLDEVVARIERNVERAKEGQISEDEFRTAVAAGDRPARPGEHDHRPSRPSRPRSTSFMAWATITTRRSTRGSRRSSSRTWSAVARKYFGNHVLVTSSPEKKRVAKRVGGGLESPYGERHRHPSGDCDVDSCNP